MGAVMRMTVWMCPGGKMLGLMGVGVVMQVTVLHRCSTYQTRHHMRVTRATVTLGLVQTRPARRSTTATGVRKLS
jgi:hypothetical protein